MTGRTHASRCHGDLARIGLGVGDQLRNGFGHDRRIGQHDLRLPDQARNRRDVAQKHEIKLVVERRVDRVEGPTMSSVWPGGGARRTVSVAIWVPAPGGFWMTRGWRSRSCSHCPIKRAPMSVEPPAAKPTTMRTGRVG